MSSHTRSRTGATSSVSNVKAKAKSNSMSMLEPRKLARRAGPVVIDNIVDTPADYRASHFTNLPLELFIEIARHLYPLDIVRLARVNKSFRGLLMHRSAIQVWQAVRRNFNDLPSCPQTISEPRYATLLFLQECSMCGKSAPHDTVPILQVRLCWKCRNQHLVNANRPLNNFFVVHRIGKKDCWGLSSDVKAVESQYNALLAGDGRELLSWMKERRQIVQDRYEVAKSLEQALRVVEKERQDALKCARKTEIETRLLKLGWEVTDFTHVDDTREREWLSLVDNTEPLENRVWKGLLPKLTELLKVNREERLQKEADSRRWDRDLSMRMWLAVFLSRSLESVARSAPMRKHTVEPSTWDPRETSGHISYSLPFPCVDHVMAWPEFNALLETDVSKPLFELELQARNDQLIQLVKNWRTKLKLGLVRLIPGDRSINHSQDCSTAEERKLFRADTIFTRQDGSHSLITYPEDFFQRENSVDGLIYDAKGVNTAKALLSALEWPDALHLEMEKLGSAFLCGRCSHPPELQTWKEMIQRYLDEAPELETMAASCRAETVFMHDIDLIDLDKPLVQIKGVQAKLEDPCSGHSS